MGFFQARILDCTAIPFSKGSPWPRDWTQGSHIIKNQKIIHCLWLSEFISLAGSKALFLWKVQVPGIFPHFKKRSISSFQYTGTLKGIRMTDTDRILPVPQEIPVVCVYTFQNQAILTASLPWFLFVWISSFPREFCERPHLLPPTPSALRLLLIC